MRFSRNKKLNEAFRRVFEEDKLFEVIEGVSGKAISRARNLEKYGVNLFFDSFKKSAVIVVKKQNKKPKWRII